mmetsp:Transcript_31001/g.84040  ORF Transcript_31001/g.84040 Transcript_31001/m.84040 type:complete len:262 (+) Transcript_31001:1138-1923(+)
MDFMTGTPMRYSDCGSTLGLCGTSLLLTLATAANVCAAKTWRKSRSRAEKALATVPAKSPCPSPNSPVRVVLLIAWATPRISPSLPFTGTHITLRCLQPAMHLSETASSMTTASPDSATLPSMPKCTAAHSSPSVDFTNGTSSCREALSNMTEMASAPSIVFASSIKPRTTPSVPRCAFIIKDHSTSESTALANEKATLCSSAPVSMPQMLSRCSFNTCSTYSSMAFRSAWLGRKSRCGKCNPLTGEVSCSCNQSSICKRS